MRIKINSSGFSLLEAIVALAIIAGFGMAIFGWINTNLMSLQKIENRNEKDRIVRSAAEFMQTIDVMSNPSGEAKMGQFQLSWTSNLIEPIKTNVSKSSGNGNYRVGLYLTQVSVLGKEGNRNFAEFEIRLVGFKETSAIPSGIF